MNEIVENLADQINRAHTEALALASGAKEQIASAVARAVECGQLMLQQKEALQHRTGKERAGWLDWLDANCPEIDERTARRYMALAKRSHVSGYFEDSATLRQAYIATGILKEPTPKEPAPPGPETPWVKFVKPLQAFRLWYHTRCEQGPPETWGESALRVLSNELQWFVNLHTELQKVRARLADDDTAPLPFDSEG